MNPAGICRGGGRGRGRRHLQPVVPLARSQDSCSGEELHDDDSGAARGMVGMAMIG